MSVETPAYISFPPGSVADEPLRIPLLWNSDHAVALAKPSQVAAFQDSRVGGGPRSILKEISARIAKEEGGQFEKLGIKSLFAINLLEREASGVVLFAKSPQAKADFKNAMGSSQFSFRYRFLTVGSPAEDELVCDLPVAIHREKPLALVSNQTGKKTTTTFRRLERFAHVSLWEAESVYDRFHQVRLHAAEVGLPVFGDTLYENARRAKEARAAASTLVPAYDGIWLHLSALSFPDGEGGSRTVEAPYPNERQMFLKKVSR